jgi:kinesin family member 2/24
MPPRQVYNEDADNETLYRGTAAPLIDRLFAHGQNSTCFAYGATGAGKTHTMMGIESEAGMYILAAQDVFVKLRQAKHSHLRLYASSFEIYGPKVFDLLNSRQCLPVREDGRKKINIVGLTQQLVPDLESFQHLLFLAADARKTAATLVHDTSSRSHAVLQLSIRPNAPVNDAPELTPRFRGREALPEALPDELGRFSFIDLAGTERGADTLNCVDRDRRIEGAEINKSLLALKVG